MALVILGGWFAGCIVNYFADQLTHKVPLTLPVCPLPCRGIGGDTTSVRAQCCYKIRRGILVADATARLFRPDNSRGFGTQVNPQGLRGALHSYSTLI